MLISDEPGLRGVGINVNSITVDRVHTMQYALPPRYGGMMDE